MTYDAIILDSDGVLVEPTDPVVWRRVNRRAFRDHGVRIPHPDHVETLDGRDVGRIEALLDAYGIDPGAFWRSRERHAIEAQRRELADGAKDAYPDIATLPSLSPSIGIVSNNQQETVDRVVDRFGLADHVEVHYGRDGTLADLARIKPDPHYLERALDAIGAEEPLFVGDSDADVAAAARLGIDSAFLRRSHRTDYEPSHSPTYEITTLYELPSLLDPDARHPMTY